MRCTMAGHAKWSGTAQSWRESNTSSSNLVNHWMVGRTTTNPVSTSDKREGYSAKEKRGVRRGKEIERWGFGGRGKEPWVPDGSFPLPPRDAARSASA